MEPGESLSFCYLELEGLRRLDEDMLVSWMWISHSTRYARTL